MPHDRETTLGQTVRSLPAVPDGRPSGRGRPQARHMLPFLQRSEWARGLLFRTRGDVLMFAAPLVITEAEIGRLVETVRESIREVFPR